MIAAELHRPFPPFTVKYISWVPLDNVEVTKLEHELPLHNSPSRLDSHRYSAIVCWLVVLPSSEITSSLLALIAPQPDQTLSPLTLTEVIEAIGLSMTKRTEETGLEVVPLSSTTVNWIVWVPCVKLSTG